MRNKERAQNAWDRYHKLPINKGRQEWDFKLGYEACLIEIQSKHANHCHCANCVDLIIMEGQVHLSDCAVHNMPAEPNGECSCKPLSI